MTRNRRLHARLWSMIRYVSLFWWESRRFVRAWKWKINTSRKCEIQLFPTSKQRYRLMWTCCAQLMVSTRQVNRKMWNAHFIWRSHHSEDSQMKWVKSDIRDPVQQLAQSNNFWRIHLDRKFKHYGAWALSSESNCPHLSQIVWAYKPFLFWKCQYYAKTLAVCHHRAINVEILINIIPRKNRKIDLGKQFR